MKQSRISSANVANWRRRSIKDATTIMGNIYIGSFVRNTILIQKQSGMNTHR